MRLGILNICILSLAGILISSSKQSLYAQKANFTAAAPAEVTMGVGFNYTITGNENINTSSIELPEIEGLRHISGPSTFISTQSSIVNGKIQNITNVTFSYTFIAVKEGKITIPAVVIKSRNKNYSTNPVEINVIAAASNHGAKPGMSESPDTPKQFTSSDKYFIRLIPSKQKVWLGEEIMVSAKVYTSENLRFSEIKYPELEGFWKQELEADQQADRETINGNQYLVQVFKRDLLIPQKTGKINITPVDVTILVQQRVRTQRRNPFGDFFNDPFFNDPFFDSYQNVPENLKSNPLTIEVKPLPQNAPLSFNGATGSFSIDLSAGKDIIKVNEALTFKFTVKGKGNLALLNAPKINFPPDVEVFDPKSSKNITHSVNGTNGSVTFEYVVIPRYPGSIRIAPVDFSFFDPVKGEYQSLKTKEIIIKVEKSEAKDQAEILGLQQNIPGALKEQVTSLNTDILFIKTNMPVFSIYGKILTDNIMFRIIFPAGIIIIVILFILQRKRNKRNSDLAYVRTRKARKIAVNRLKRAKKLLMDKDPGLYDEILKALWGYIGDKLSVDQANLSRQTASEGLILNHIPEEIIQELIELIENCEMARYATGMAVNPESVYKRSEEVLYRIESLMN